MTGLSRIVKRSIATDRRPLVVELTPGLTPTLTLREKGRRSGYTITLAGLYVVLAQRDAENKRAAKRAARRNAR